MLEITRRTHRRRIGLTPMIDVVFLLLVFFMLAARFGATDAIPLTLSGGDNAAYDGPPRLVTVTPDTVHVNGIITETPARALAPLMRQNSDTVILRTQDGASVQRLLDVMTGLRNEGMTQLVVLE